MTLPVCALCQELPLPPDKPIAKIPDKYLWVRIGEPPEKSQAGPPLILTVEVTKSEGIRRTATKYSNGTSETEWFTKNIFLTDAGGRLRVYDIDPVFPATPAPTDVSELAWVDKGNYQKTEMFDQKPAWLFEKKEIIPLVAGSDESIAKILKAWIDPKTGRPLAFYDGTLLWRYQFTPFDGTLSVPGSLLEEFEKFQQRNAKDEALRSRIP